MFWPCETRTSTCRNFATISSGVYRFFGIAVLLHVKRHSSGRTTSKGEDQFDNLHRDATRRRFDLVMAWSVDRLGRSLQDLVGFLEHLRETRCELFLHQQGLDTTTSSDRAMFGMLSVFAEFERS